MSPQTAGRILVVDDDPDNRAMLSEALGEEGFEIVEAENGREAIDYVLHHPEPDVILLDLLMPGISGWEVLSVLRTYLRLRRIPVIIVSAQPAAMQIPSADVVAQLQKPYRLNELVALVHRHGQSRSPTTPA